MGKESPFTIVYRAAKEDYSDSDKRFEIASGQPFSQGEILESISTADTKSITPRRRKSAKKKTVPKKGVKPAIATGTTPKQASTIKYLGAISGADPALIDDLNSLNPDLRRTLLTSSFRAGVSLDANEVVGRLRPVVDDIRKGGQAVTVAFMDIDARVGRMPDVIEALNASQQLFTFFDLQAPLPAGLLIRSDRFDSWAKHRAGRKRVSQSEREEFADNLMFNDFYKYARVVRQTSGVDYLVGITQYMIASEEEGVYYWNYFSNGHGPVILSSAYDLREYAKKAGRPFEIAVALVALAQLLAQINKKIDYHEDTGCIFDENIDRAAIVKSLKKATIESNCLDKLDPKYRSAAEAMMQALRDYQRPADPTTTPIEKKPQTKKLSDSYWLDELNKLSEKLKNSGNT